MSKELFVELKEEIVEIPTYPVGEPDKNPMFLEKRVYQGSSGKVYPLPFTDKIYDEKVNKNYKVISLENKYLKIEILPELGGRIQRAYDKTNAYDFVYYNQVIKPALVGLTGPWISGGIEFNWPQHHRPRTYSPIEYYFEENNDGSKTVWVSEIDRMYGTKGMAGFTLYPDKAYLEIKGQLYNRTSTSQTFLWWANPAVAVNENYKSVFPPDVNAVFDHGKRDVSEFPIAKSEYYKVDYSAGVDISMYKNIPVPTSYMAYHSDYDFVGGYDYGKEAGILHVADHHISPGKKQWTWGNGDFGQAWYRNLTDEDGPYIELMTGVYTDNQPDFTWLKPYEEKTFKQYFMPYKKVGEVKNANIDIMVNLEFKGEKACVYVYTTSDFNNLKVVLKTDQKKYLEEIIDISPESAYFKRIEIDSNVLESEYKLEVLSKSNKILISYQAEGEKNLEIPEPAQAAAEPKDIETNEELYLTGLHLEQYRHATYDPDNYYLEGLKRDPGDIRINNAYGRLLYQRGLFEESEEYFRKAIERLTWKNPNPYNSEPYYNLGLVLDIQGKENEAFDAFYKSVWSGEWQESSYYMLALIASRRGDYQEALEYIDKSIVKNYHNTKARNIKAVLLRNLEELDSAEEISKKTIEIDKLDFLSRNELYYLYQLREQQELSSQFKEELSKIMRDSYHNYLEAALDYASAGFYREAIELLERYIDLLDGVNVYPLVYYYLAYYYLQESKKEKALNLFKKGENADPSYCFPNRLSTIPILEKAMEMNPEDSKALYYLANLYYDKKQYNKAIALWEKSSKLNEKFSTVFRNMALAYYNKYKQREKARKTLEKAFELDKKDARVVFELDQLYKNINISYRERLDFLEKYKELLNDRDDLYIEYVTLYNNLGHYEKALDLLMERNFHPWEGGEGKVTTQYVVSCREIAREAINSSDYDRAISMLERAKTYPENLGEGKLPIAFDNDLDYLLGSAYQKLSEENKTNKFFDKASVGIDAPGSMMFYNDQPADLMYYQGMALKQRGKIDLAEDKFKQLYSYGEKHLGDDVKIDYFAVSLPDFLVFDVDLNKKNKIHCHYLMGLGLMGLGDYKAAIIELEKAHLLNKYHQGVLVHLKIAKDIKIAKDEN